MAVTETRSLPPKFVEDLGKDYATQLTGLTSQKMDTTKYQPMVAGQDQATQQAYNMATTQGQGIGSYAPYMAQAGALQGMGLNYLQRAQAQSGVQGQQLGLQGQQLGAQARQLGAVGQQIGAQRQQLGAVGQQLQAQGAYSGPQAYKQFMSPYQQDVINATMTDYDKQAAKGMSGIGQMAAKSGNLGGGREGVMRAEYKNNSDMNRALLQGKMLQQGFGQANQLANQAFNQQGQLTQGQQNLFQGQGQLTDQERNMFTGQGQLFQGQGQLVAGQQNLFNNQQNLMQGANTLGADQQRMAQLMPQLRGSDISTLGQAGRGQQLYNQSVLDQQREANRMAAYEPYERLGYMGAGMGNVMGGAMGQYQSQVTPNQSPLQQALGIASLGLGAYKGFQNRG